MSVKVSSINNLTAWGKWSRVLWQQYLYNGRELCQKWLKILCRHLRITQKQPFKKSSVQSALFATSKTSQASRGWQFGATSKNQMQSCPQFHQHFTSSFFSQYSFVKKIQTQTISREKLCVKLSLQKSCSWNVGKIDTRFGRYPAPLDFVGLEIV